MRLLGLRDKQRARCSLKLCRGMFIRLISYVAPQIMSWSGSGHAANPCPVAETI